jgi:NAD(P)-dependent dehydrogenase (short-subunit alcohol dehydrogenase family)
MENKFSLSGKKALLSGAGGYFGPYFAEAILASGAELVAIGKTFGPEFTDKFSKEMGARKLHLYEVDYYNEPETLALYEVIKNKHGVFDVLVNNAFDFSLRTGFNDPSGKLENSTYEQLRSSFESGVYWSIRATKHFGFPMKEKGSGSIINICSMYGVVVPSPDLYEGTEKFNPPGYSMAKAGLLQFTKYAASFLSPEVRVNAISPGAIPNLGNSTYNAIKDTDPVLNRLHQKILLKRMGHPKDLTGAMVFLASDASSYITGQNIIIDGGLTVT